MNIQFDTYNEWDELVYCAREARIRFRRLRSEVLAGRVTHWTVEECDARIEQYTKLEEKIFNMDHPEYG